MSEITPEEQKKRDDSGLQSLVTKIVQAERQKWREETQQALEGFQVPDRSDVPEITKPRGDVAELAGDRILRTASPTDPIYRRMGEEERKIRTPDVDHYIAEWARGFSNRDQSRMFQADAKLRELRPDMYARADVVEGAAGAAGALSNSGASGGALIPRPMEALVNIARDRVAKGRRLFNIVNMTAQTHTIPTSAAMTTGMIGENAAIADGAPTFASVQLSANKGACIAVISQETLDDVAVNVVGNITQRAGTSLGVLEDNQFFADGNGTPPNISAILTGTVYNENTSTELGFTDVLTMYFNVAQQYRSQGVWLAAPNVLQMLTQLTNATSGNPFYSGLHPTTLGVFGDDPMQEGFLLRRPIIEVPFASGVIFFGDPRATYTIGLREGIRVSMSEHDQFTLDMVTWKFTQRFDGINVDAVAGQKALGIASVTDNTF